jgi:hypothetical protein
VIGNTSIPHVCSTVLWPNTGNGKLIWNSFTPIISAIKRQVTNTLDKERREERGEEGECKEGVEAGRKDERDGKEASM